MKGKKEIDYIAHSVVETGNGKSRWKEVGVAFKNKSSISILVDAMPISGKIVLLPKTEKEIQDVIRNPNYKPIWREKDENEQAYPNKTY